jgi:hypothetical protein
MDGKVTSGIHHHLKNLGQLTIAGNQYFLCGAAGNRTRSSTRAFAL